jgi:hypothetical protein
MGKSTVNITGMGAIPVQNVTRIMLLQGIFSPMRVAQAGEASLFNSPLHRIPAAPISMGH